MKDPKCNYKGDLITKEIETLAESETNSHIVLNFKCNYCNQKYSYHVDLSVWNLDIPISVDENLGQKLWGEKKDD